MNDPEFRERIWNAKKKDPFTHQEFCLKSGFTNSAGLFYPFGVMTVLEWILPFTSTKTQAEFADIIKRITVNEDIDPHDMMLSLIGIWPIQWKAASIGNAAYYVMYSNNCTALQRLGFERGMDRIRMQVLFYSLIYFTAFVVLLPMSLYFLNYTDSFIVTVFLALFSLLLPLLKIVIQYIILTEVEPTKPLSLDEGCFFWFSDKIPNAMQLYDQWGNPPQE